MTKHTYSKTETTPAGNKVSVITDASWPKDKLLHPVSRRTVLKGVGQVAASVGLAYFGGRKIKDSLENTDPLSQARAAADAIQREADKANVPIPIERRRPRNEHDRLLNRDAFRQVSAADHEVWVVKDSNVRNSPRRIESDGEQGGRSNLAFNVSGDEQFLTVVNPIRYQDEAGHRWLGFTLQTDGSDTRTYNGMVDNTYWVDETGVKLGGGYATRMPFPDHQDSTPVLIRPGEDFQVDTYLQSTGNHNMRIGEIGHASVMDGVQLDRFIQQQHLDTTNSNGG